MSWRGGRVAAAGGRRGNAAVTRRRKRPGARAPAAEPRAGPTMRYCRRAHQLNRASAPRAQSIHAPRYFGRRFNCTDSRQCAKMNNFFTCFIVSVFLIRNVNADEGVQIGKLIRIKLLESFSRKAVIFPHLPAIFMWKRPLSECITHYTCSVSVISLWLLAI